MLSQQLKEQKLNGEQQKKSHKPIYKSNPKNEAKRFKSTSFAVAKFKKRIAIKKRKILLSHYLKKRNFDGDTSNMFVDCIKENYMSIYLNLLNTNRTKILIS